MKTNVSFKDAIQSNIINAKVNYYIRFLEDMNEIICCAFKVTEYKKPDIHAAGNDSDIAGCNVTSSIAYIRGLSYQRY